MKLAAAVICLSVTVMVLMTFQAVNQELALSSMKSSMVKNTAEIKRREQAIIEVKTKIKDMKTMMAAVSTNIDELRKKKENRETLSKDLDKSLQTCNTETADADKKKTDTGEAVAKLKADHVEAKKKAEEDIQNLKQQILDKDKAICTFADTTKEEARKLCGIPETSK